MWHEARKQEKKIKVMMVDYQKRSERRRAYYQRIKADPTQFIRLTGNPCKIYVEEEAMEIKGALSDLMPWQSNKSNLIDRFDVRAHLDIIHEYNGLSDPSTIDENAVIGQKCSYERYRTLSTNDLVGITEDECLEQIQEDEKIILPIREKKYGKKAAIGFSYSTVQVDEPVVNSDESEATDEEDETYLTQDTDLDITFDVRELAPEQKEKLNEIAATFYSIPDFVRLHVEDKVEAEMREYEMKEEQQRIDRVAKMSKKERRVEKEARRKIREPMIFYKIDDPHRIQDDPPYPYKKERDRKISESSSGTSDEETAQLNIEISSAPHLKSIDTTKLPLPSSSINRIGLVSLAATRRALLSKQEDEFQLVGPALDTDEEKSRRSSTQWRSSSTESESHLRTRNRTRSKSHSTSPRHHHTRRSSSGSPHRRGRFASSSRSRSNSPIKKKGLHTPPPPSKANVTVKGLKPHERLKLKLQKQITKQLKQEKRKDQMLEEQREQEMMDREEELRDLKRRIRDREDEERRSRRTRSKSRSKSRSPQQRSRSPRRARSRHSSRSESRSKHSNRSRERSERSERRRDYRENKRDEPVEQPVEPGGPTRGEEGGLIPEYHQYQTYENNYNESTEHQRNDYRPSYSRHRPRRYNRDDEYGGDERKSYNRSDEYGGDERKSYNRSDEYGGDERRNYNRSDEYGIDERRNYNSYYNNNNNNSGDRWRRWE